jgi:hypothetical protein
VHFWSVWFGRCARSVELRLKEAEMKTEPIEIPSEITDVTKAPIVRRMRFYVAEHSVIATLTALAAGFFVGRIFSRL